MDLSRQTVLITGAAGFIGSHVSELALARFGQVRAMVRYNSQGACGWLDTLPAEAAKALDIRAGDIRDADFVSEAAKGCDVVLHLAALIGIPYSYVAPESYVAVNVTGTLNVLMAAREHGIAKTVTTSTSEVYGTAQSVPISESHPLNAQSPYAATKIAADQLALSFQRSFGMPVAVVRPFNTYGPRQSARAVIPTIISQIAAGNAEIELGTLSPTRDFSFVGDTARGIVAVAACDEAVGEVVNLGSAFEVSIGDTANLIAGLMGASVSIRAAAARVRPADSEVERLFADTGKAQRLLGWVPEFGGRDGLERGLGETIAWFREPANLARYRAGEYGV